MNGVDLSNAAFVQDEMGRPFIIVREYGSPTFSILVEDIFAYYYRITMLINDRFLAVI